MILLTRLLMLIATISLVACGGGGGGGGGRSSPEIESANVRSLSAGTLEFSMQVYGRNLDPQSTILINGSPATTRYVSPDSVWVFVPDQVLSQPGTLELTVRDEKIDKISASSVNILVHPAKFSVETLAGNASHMVWDDQRQRLYVSDGNSILSINPESRSIVDAIDLGMPVNILSISANRSVLFAGTDEGVYQLAIPDFSHISLIEAPLKEGVNAFGRYEIASIAASPFDEDLVAVAYNGGTGGKDWVGIYTGNELLTKYVYVIDHGELRSLCWNNNGEQLVGANETSKRIDVFTFLQNELMLEKKLNNTFNLNDYWELNSTIKCIGDNKLYSNGGGNTQTGSLIDIELGVWFKNIPARGAVLEDLGNEQVLVIWQDRGPTGGSRKFIMSAFDIDTMSVKQEVTFPTYGRSDDIDIVDELIYAPNRLAFVSEGDIYFVDYEGEPGSWESSAIPISGRHSNNGYQLQVVDAGNISDALWDATRQKILVSMSSLDRDNPKAIQTIDPITGAISSLATLEGNAYDIELSADGMTLFGAGRASIIDRYTLPDGQQLPPIYLGYDEQDLVPDPFIPLTMATSPFNNDVLAVVKGIFGVNATPGGSDGDSISIFDGVTEREIHTYSISTNRIAWGGTVSELYGLNSYSSAYSFLRYYVDESGIEFVSEKKDAFDGYFQTLSYDPASGYVYISDGSVLDPLTSEKITTLDLPQLTGAKIAVFDGKIYTIGESWEYLQTTGEKYITLFRHDAVTYERESQVEFPNFFGDPVSIFGTKNGVLAVLSNSGVLYLISGNIVK